MFEKGNKYSTGKPKGAVSKQRKEFLQTMEEHGFSPAEAFLYLYSKAKEGIEHGNRQELPQYIQIAAGLVKDMASYVYPKLSSVTVNPNNPLDGMTAEQKLEAMREAVKLMEREVGDSTKRLNSGSSKT